MFLNKKFTKVMELGLNEVSIKAYGEREAEKKVLADGSVMDFSAFLYINIETDDGAYAQVRFYDNEADGARLNASLNAINSQLETALVGEDVGSILEDLKTKGTKFKVVLKANPSKDDADKVYTNFYFDKQTISNYSRRAR